MNYFPFVLHIPFCAAASSATPEWRNSRISIQAADRTHSGTYSCSLMNTTLTVVNVQVLNGECETTRRMHCPILFLLFVPQFVACQLFQPNRYAIHFSALLPGEMPAAVQHNAGARPGLGQSPKPLILVLLFYSFLLSAHIC